MATYLLTWNPKRWTWETLTDAANEVAERGRLLERWSCGNTRKIERGDRVFLLRQGREPRGIVASGTVVRAPYQAEHWNPKHAKLGWYVDLEFDALQDPDTDPILPRERLDAPEFADVYWNTQSSGIAIPTHVATALEREWAVVLGLESPARSGLSSEPRPLYEGAGRAVTLNVYERNPEARRRCIAHYGVSCVACGFDFGRVYGAEAEGFIHVHHLRPVSELGERYVVDPIADLRPICPNCHAVIHRTPKPYTIEQIQEMMRASSEGR